MALTVDYEKLREGAKLVEEAATWVESAVETHTRAMAGLEEHLAGSATAGLVVDLSRQLTDVGADAMPALQGFAQGLDAHGDRLKALDADAGAAARGGK